jgi:hypothetical protein
MSRVIPRCGLGRRRLPRRQGRPCQAAHPRTSDSWRTCGWRSSRHRPGAREVLPECGADTRGRLSRLTSAVASGGDLPALLAALKERQGSRERCQRALIELDATARIGQRELSRLEREIRHRLADWRAMLRREVPEAREILRNLIVGRIVFTPRPETRLYEFSGRGRWGGCWPGRPVQFRW